MTLRGIMSSMKQLELYIRGYDEAQFMRSHLLIRSVRSKPHLHNMKPHLWAIRTVYSTERNQYDWCCCKCGLPKESEVGESRSGCEQGSVPGCTSVPTPLLSRCRIKRMCTSQEASELHLLQIENYSVVLKHAFRFKDNTSAFRTFNGSIEA